MTRTVGIGIQSYCDIIENNCFYVDKTSFIREWWESKDSITLITRPRRFGKTLTMSMVEQFFSVDYAGRGNLFERLSIWRDEQYRTLLGTYPVISLSFANVKEKSYEIARKKICQMLTDLYADHWFLLNSTELEESDREFFRRVTVDMDDADASMALHNMMKFAKDVVPYNEFLKALLLGDLDAMNEYMNRVTLETFSSFDTGKRPSGKTEPERFYHGFVLGLMVELRERYSITSNRESGFGRYDVVLEPLSAKDDAFIIEFKVHNPRREENLEETLQNALRQIADKKYETTLLSKGIRTERIQKYGFAFDGKTVLIG